MAERAPETDGRRTAAAARRRKREAEIIGATRALFDRSGVRDAQIDQIAQAVGVNRAIVYRHFTGKEELFALTLVEYLDELREALTEADAAGGDAGRPADPDHRGVRRLRRRPPRVRRLRADADAPYRPRAARGDVGVGGVAARPGDLHLPGGPRVGARGRGRGRRLHASTTRPCSPNTLYASGLGALQLARVGILVKEASPGVPTVGQVSPEQVRDYLVASALALATR